MKVWPQACMQDSLKWTRDIKNSSSTYTAKKKQDIMIEVEIMTPGMQVRKFEIDMWLKKISNFVSVEG